MKLGFIELRIYHKLKPTRIGFDENRTLFIGAKNSGKASVMLTLRTFLEDAKKLKLRDVSIACIPLQNRRHAPSSQQLAGSIVNYLRRPTTSCPALPLRLDLAFAAN